MSSPMRVGTAILCLAVAACSVRAQAPPHPVVPGKLAPQTTTRLTLDDAHRTALQNHPRIQAAQSAAAAAGQVTTEVRSAYFPTLYGSITGVEADPGSRIAAGALNNPQIFNRFATGLSIEQLVTDFGRTKNLTASARLQAQAAEAEVNFSRADVLLSVDRAFFGALRAQAILQVAQATVKARDLVVQQIDALAQGGFKTGLDVSFAQVNLSEAQLLLVKAQNDVQASQAVLTEALGVSTQQRFDLVEPAGSTSALPLMDDALAIAIQSRPELAVQRLQVESAQHFATAERDLAFPTLSLAGAAGEVPFRQPEIPQGYAAGGFNLHIPIFNGRLFSARHAEAESHAREAAALLNDEQGQVARDVQLAWLSANVAQQNLALTAQLLAEADKALDLAQARYDNGLGNIVELSQAQLNQAQAAIAQAGAKYDYATRLAELAFQEGVLH